MEVAISRYYVPGTLVSWSIGWLLSWLATGLIGWFQWTNFVNAAAVAAAIAAAAIDMKGQKSASAASLLHWSLWRESTHTKWTRISTCTGTAQSGSRLNDRSINRFPRLASLPSSHHSINVFNFPDIFPSIYPTNFPDILSSITTSIQRSVHVPINPSISSFIPPSMKWSVCW